MEKEFKEALILQLVNCALLRTICFQNRSKVRPTWRDITGSVSEDHGPTDNALAKAIWNQKTAWIDSRLPQSYELQNIIQRSLDDIANKLCPRRYWCGSDSASDFSCLAGMYIRGMAPEISLAVIDKLGITDSGTKEGDVLPNRHTLNCMSTSTTPLLNQQKKFTDWDLACLWSRSKEHFTVVDFDREAATADIVRQAQEMLENHLYDTRYF
jgi:hypothetical protein